jgi:hypothetical protein
VSKALLSYAVGGHQKLLDIALPTFQEFADRHGYDLLIPEPMGSARPPSWHKIPALIAALRDYDEVLFLDADTVIVDSTDDLDVPAEAWQALVRHATGDGDVPNCGVWFVRRPMLPVLEQQWSMTQYLKHGWWEQAAMHELLGFGNRPVTLIAPTRLCTRTHFLDPGWNVHKWHNPQPAHPRIMHASMHDDRAGIMREWATEAMACAS